MGQYYHAAIKQGRKTTVYNQQVQFDRKKNNWDYYNGVKLMEHSWWANDFCVAFAHKLLNNKVRVVWCGDYAEKNELKAIKFPADTYSRGETNLEEIKDWSLDDVKYLINHDKKCYVDLRHYKEKSNDDGWIAFPISILTAVGNGRGGGDYDGTCQEDVGTWAGDLIELSDELPNGYEELDVFFKEGR